MINGFLGILDRDFLVVVLGIICFEIFVVVFDLFMFLVCILSVFFWVMIFSRIFRLFLIGWDFWEVFLNGKGLL